MNESERICRLCGKQKETWKDISEKCEITDKEGYKWKKLINGKGNLDKLQEVCCRRKRAERIEDERKRRDAENIDAS